MAQRKETPRALPIQTKRLVWIFGNFQKRMEQNRPKLKKKKNRGKHREVYQNFRIFFPEVEISFHLSLLPQFLELSVGWFAFRTFNSFQNFWKLFREISVPFTTSIYKFLKDLVKWKAPASLALGICEFTKAIFRPITRLKFIGNYFTERSANFIQINKNHCL